jgi:hypothetical protein
MSIFGELSVGAVFLDPACGETFTKTEREVGVCGDPNSPVYNMSLPFDCSDQVQEVGFKESE